MDALLADEFQATAQALAAFIILVCHVLEAACSSKCAPQLLVIYTYIYINVK